MKVNKIIRENKYSSIAINFEKNDKSSFVIEHYNLSKSKYMDKWIILNKEDLKKIYEIINEQE